MTGESGRPEPWVSGTEENKPGAGATVDIIVNNHNYARFLREAIDSALEQTYPGVRVVVVDDGSEDESPQIIGHYADRVVSVYKQKRWAGFGAQRRRSREQKRHCAVSRLRRCAPAGRRGSHG